jgi:peroxiredoxin
MRFLLHYMRFIKQLLLCLIIPVSLFSHALMADEEQTTEDKQLAWNFTLKSQHGKNIKLSELRGQVIALNFWATWCGTCLQQFPALNYYQQKNSAKGFTVLSINIDEDLLTATRHVKKRKFNYPVLFDSLNMVSRLYSVDDLPTLFLIDRDGYLRYTLDDSKIKQQKITQQVIEDLLNE